MDRSTRIKNLQDKLNRLPESKIKEIERLIGTEQTDVQPLSPKSDTSNMPVFHRTGPPNRASNTFHHRISADELQEEFYNMTHIQRGKALIINNKKFTAKNDGITLSTRDGSEHDASSMFQRFLEKGFNVSIEHDLKKGEIIDSLTECANDKETNEQADCFACVILSHGSEDGIYGTDGIIGFQDIFKPFYASNCPSLKGKPKIFIFQCCRGKQLLEGVDVKVIDDSADDNVPDSAPDYSEYVPCGGPKIPSHVRIPNMADFLIIFASVQGYQSFRNTETGSPFIRFLSKHLENSQEWNMYKLLTHVNKEFMDYKPNESANECFKGKVQMPCFESTLMKELIIKPKDN